MTAQGQEPVAEVAERPHLALRRAVVDVAVNVRRTGVLSHSGHANLSARVGPNAIVLAAFSQIRDLGLDDLAVVHLDGTVAECDLAGMSSETVATHRGVPGQAAGRRRGPHALPSMLAFALAGRTLPADMRRWRVWDRRRRSRWSRGCPAGHWTRQALSLR